MVSPIPVDAAAVLMETVLHDSAASPVRLLRWYFNLIVFRDALASASTSTLNVERLFRGHWCIINKTLWKGI
jgi:hypothetical protein